METALIITETVVAILLTVLILAQNKDGGLSAMMGGGGSFQSTKRGAEKVIYNLTIALATLFLVLALVIALI
jgi:preprotein translocase subunit SecG